MTHLNIQKELLGSDGAIYLDIDKEIENSKLTVLFGKSGAGKSTILKIIAGLVEPDSGEIVINGKTWYSKAKGINLPPQKRAVGFVFQDYALFPNMSVRQNLVYALEAKSRIHKVDEILELMELTKLSDLKPETLSGGQKQRVALARALVREPEILLLDEPLSALDFAMRTKLQDELLRLQKLLGITTLLVSHDKSEVFKLAHSVIDLQMGKIVKSGTPMELFGGENISGKFKFSGEIVDISKSDIVYVVSVLVGQNIIKIVATEDEVSTLKIGDNVIISSKAFNPIIVKS
ncbi:ABC transporter ATP-binding protein [Arcobacter sp. FWKO B]|uniref:ABC transporter ATP-binding protein n=1 Tax=Arcobacter sp. FWKO B TaxID=2593672 RepID=UPI0018A33CDE|nr:ATP-binding cassette domain-containing protein [Arcobacter sp. FWKO B]QOG12417.1 ATP-binding cassette domain-containing protein [Arcobacter sp. FWKO B]